MVYSLLVPLISIFAATFFLFKYYVDKYNLVFVYCKVYDSDGKIRKVVTRIMIFNIFMYTLIMMSYFATI